jgi:thymidine phosphorylase
VISAAELIQRKRDGDELTPEELTELVLAYARDDVPDYQMAAFCMAVYFRGLTSRETFALTDAMIRSGETIDLGPRSGGRSSTSTRPAASATRRRSPWDRSSPPAAFPSGR